MLLEPPFSDGTKKKGERLGTWEQTHFSQEFDVMQMVELFLTMKMHYNTKIREALEINNGMYVRYHQ
jgi:hypothetical protein